MSYYERPEFKVIIEEKPFELRHYEPFYVVTYSDKEDANLNYGFQTLFNYLSKNNREEKKISMTVPVIESKKEGTQKMSFVVPKAFGDNPPQPLDSRLQIEKIEGGSYAAISYRGNSDDEVEREKEELLMSWIEKHQWKVAGIFQVAYFNPPLTPGLIRHNEIIVKIEGV